MKFWEGGKGYVVYSESRALTPHPNRCRVGFVQNGLGLAPCPRLREENPIGFPASPRSPCPVHRRFLEAKYCFMSETLNHAASKRTLICIVVAEPAAGWEGSMLAPCRLLEPWDPNFRDP